MSSHHDAFETLAIHAGQDPDPLTGAVVPPIHQASTFKQDGVGGLRGGYEYSRTANPTRTALEECLAALEEGRRALAFASGMAAEDCLIRTVCQPGDRVIIPNDAYVGTYRLFATVGKDVRGAFLRGGYRCQAKCQRKCKDSSGEAAIMMHSSRQDNPPEDHGIGHLFGGAFPKIWTLT